MYILKELNEVSEKLKKLSEKLKKQEGMSAEEKAHIGKQLHLFAEIVEYIKSGKWCTYDGEERKPRERFMYCLKQMNGKSVTEIVADCAEHYGISESSVRSLLSRMSTRIYEQIGKDTLKLLLSSEEEDLTKAELRYYVGTNQYKKVVNIDMLTDTEIDGRVGVYTMRECLREILYLQRHSAKQIERERQGLDQDKLNFLIKLLNIQGKGGTYTALATKYEKEREILYKSLCMSEAVEIKKYIEESEIIQ